MLLHRLKTMGEQLLTQDNRGTAHPVYAVQQRRRVITEEERDVELRPGPPGTWEEVGYVDTWETVQSFFTRQGADWYIEKNRHNLEEPRIYVDSAHRNEEWQLIREYLMSLAR